VATHAQRLGNQSCEGQARSSLAGNPRPRKRRGLLLARIAQLDQPISRSFEVGRIASRSRWLTDDNNNTSSQNQNTTIPDDGMWVTAPATQIWICT
jgi:hypothetical protein